MINVIVLSLSNFGRSLPCTKTIITSTDPALGWVGRRMLNQLLTGPGQCGLSAMTSGFCFTRRGRAWSIPPNAISQAMGTRVKESALPPSSKARSRRRGFSSACSGWRAGILVCWLLPAAVTVTSASVVEITLTNGRVFSEAEILSRDNESVTFLDRAYGVQRSLPLDSIRSIGDDMVHPEPAPGKVARTAKRWGKMDIFLACFAAAAALWILMLWAVQIELDELFPGRPHRSMRLNTMVLLLPGLGLIVYLVARRKFIQQQGALPSVTTRVVPAGGGATQRPWKKWRFLFKRPRTPAGPMQTKEEKLNLIFLDHNDEPIDIKKSLPGSSGMVAAYSMLSEAIVQRASDVHIEPLSKSHRVRFRVDGVLRERKHLAKIGTNRAVAALKTLAGIDVAEKRKSQDGRFAARTSLGDIDLRVATATSIHGEKLVVRILIRKTGLMTLGELGMGEEMMATITRNIHSHNGMVLVTGPTGSGKTTTLYAALNQLDATRLNIMTIEDPVEYELAGANQLPVNPRAGLTYASGLRAILRQDPDVIFIGEMRDEEAAAIAVRSALTGHLVFSSLHSNSAIATLTRLLELGIERYQIASSLLLVVAQRLVRVLCRGCREPYQPSEEELTKNGFEMLAGQEIYRARGCENCNGTGYFGRTGIFEIFMMDDEARRMFQTGATDQELWTAAKRRGSKTRHEHGQEKILAGLTTIKEVMEMQ